MTKITATFWQVSLDCFVYLFLTNQCPLCVFSDQWTSVVYFQWPMSFSLSRHLQKQSSSLEIQRPAVLVTLPALISNRSKVGDVQDVFKTTQSVSYTLLVSNISSTFWEKTTQRMQMMLMLDWSLNVDSFLVSFSMFVVFFWISYDCATEEKGANTFLWVFFSNF